MIKKNKPSRSKKVKTTCAEFVSSLSPKEKKEFDEEFKEFVLSEILLAIMAEDEISVRGLAKMADVSPTVVQAMRSNAKKDFSMKSFFKILRSLGFKKLTAERNGHSYTLDIPDLRK